MAVTFDMQSYPFDEKHNALNVEGEAMIFHCHHYINYLQRSILDADYIDSEPFLIGSAADAVYNQLKSLCQGHNEADAKSLAEQMYKAFGYGLINLSEMNEEGLEMKTFKSFFSKTWPLKFGAASKPIDYYTRGYLAAAYAVIYQCPLSQVHVEQTTCMACGDEFNHFIVRPQVTNFALYPPKKPTQFKEIEKLSINWEHEDTITQAFLGAHAHFVGNEEGYINAFGVYLVRNQSDYVNRLQFEFIRAMNEVAGEYGETLAIELLLEAGHACGFFTYAGIMTSDEWKTVVQPLLTTKEDWIKGLASLINTMGWGYHTAVELSQEKAIFRNYNDFEDLSYMRMYGTSSYPVHWANSGGFTGLMQLIYNTNIVNGDRIDSEEGFREMRRSKAKYKTLMNKGISMGDDYLEVEVSL